MYCTTIIPAGGKGIRLGSDIPKQYLELAGKPIIIHTLENFQRSEKIDSIIISASEDRIEYLWNIITKYKISKVHDIVIGGIERQDSISNALQSKYVEMADIILVHDSVRPFINPKFLSDIIDKAYNHGAVIPGLKPKETIKVIISDFVGSTPNRNNLIAVQTPQAFKKDLLLDAYKKAQEQNFKGTDDSSLIERAGYKVKIIDGLSQNIKITTKIDLDFAEMMLKKPAN